MENTNLNKQGLINEVRKEATGENKEIKIISENIEEKDTLMPNYKILGSLGVLGLAGGGYTYFQCSEGGLEKNIESENYPTYTKVCSDIDPETINNAQINIDIQDKGLSPFEQAFSDARIAELRVFEWQGHLYHTKTKEEMSGHYSKSEPNQIPGYNGSEKMSIEQDGKEDDENINILVNEETKVASDVQERDINVTAHQAVETKNYTYGGIDTNNDGKYDTIVLDINSDGKVDAMGSDENNDGVFEVFITNDNQDTTLDTLIRDNDGNGPDLNDINESVSYEINMSDYEPIEDPSSYQENFDILENLF